MKTEYLQRSPRSHDAWAVSRALQDLAPLTCRIVDRHGKGIPLSAAGYVLRYGGSYHVQVVSPIPEEEMSHVSIVNTPPFINVDQELLATDEHGRKVHSIPFKVPSNLLSRIRWFGADVRYDDLEIAHYPRQGSPRDSVKHLCPIVVRPRWLIVVVAVVISLALLLVERIIHILLESEVSPSQSAANFIRSLETRSDLLLWLAGLALLIWFVVYCINLWMIYYRSKALRKVFRQNYGQVLG